MAVATMVRVYKPVVDPQPHVPLNDEKREHVRHLLELDQTNRQIHETVGISERQFRRYRTNLETCDAMYPLGQSRPARKPSDERLRRAFTRDVERADQDYVELLILGAGWTSTFLAPLLTRLSITHAATSTTGRESTIPFVFSPSSTDLEPYKRLPSARTVLITFPLKGPNQSQLLTSLYRDIHGPDSRFIQLGSSGIFTAPHWNDANSPYDTADTRAVAEDELIKCAGGCVLNLAGLYGGPRDPKHWVGRVIKTREDARKRKAIHMVHGEDVARAVVAVHKKFTPAQRWLITDTRVYDWWDLLASYGADMRRKEEGGGLIEEGEQIYLELGKWVGEFMVEEGIRALPRSPETLGRVCDSTHFWHTMGVWPGVGRVR